LCTQTRRIGSRSGLPATGRERVAGDDESPRDLIAPPRREPDPYGLSDLSPPVAVGDLIFGHPHSPAPQKKRAVLFPADPHRLSQSAWAGRQKTVVADRGPPRPHQLDAFYRLTRPQQDGLANSLRTADHVRTPVHPVREVDVQATGGPEHRPVAVRHPPISVRAGVDRSAVGLDLHEPHARPPLGRGVDENASDQVARNGYRVALVERSEEPAQPQLGPRH
jgi:hypothetical protein